MYVPHLDNVRAGLDWAFSPEGDPQIALALTVAVVPLWVELSLLGECRERVERALAITPNNVTAQLLKGSISAGLKDPETAIAEINDAIRMNPRDARSYAVLVDVQLSLGHHAEAEAAFKRGIETEPTSPLVWMALANFYLSVGRPTEAEPLLKRSIPVLITLFLLVVAAARAFGIYGEAVRMEDAALLQTQLTASAISVGRMHRSKLRPSSPSN